MADLDETKLASLAREMAMAIRTYEAIFADYGIDEYDFYEISKNPFYQRARDEFALQWNAATSVHKRVELGSAASLELLLPTLAARAKSGTEPLQASNDVAKLLARAAGIGEPKPDRKDPGERFVITINLGDDKPKTYDMALAPIGTPAPELENKSNETS